MFTHANLALATALLLIAWLTLMVCGGRWAYEGHRQRRNHNTHGDLQWAWIKLGGGLSTMLYVSSVFLLPAIGVILDRQWMQTPEARSAMSLWFIALTVSYVLFIGLLFWLISRIARKKRTTA